MMKHDCFLCNRTPYGVSADFRNGGRNFLKFLFIELSALGFLKYNRILAVGLISTFLCGCETPYTGAVNQAGDSAEGLNSNQLSRSYPRVAPYCVISGRNVESELFSIIRTLEQDPDFIGDIIYIKVKWDEIPLFAEVRVRRQWYNLTKYNYQRQWVILDKNDQY